MQLAFYCASTGTWYDRLVALCSRPGPYSHVEIRWDGGELADGMFFSSSPRDGGCRFKVIPVDYHWDVIDVPGVTSEMEDRARDFCRKHVKPRRYKYDWAGVFRFIFPSIPLKLSRHRRFCSEMCLEALQRIGVLEGFDARKVSPNELAFLLRMRNASRKWEITKEAA